MLSFKHEVFQEVARLKSFTKASQALFISQPSISKHIKQLEEDYKVSLFERKGNTIELTHEGKILYDALLKARAIEKQLEFDISTSRNPESAKGELKLGASTTVALYIIPSVLSDFHQKHSHVSITLVNRNSENVLKALLDHEIDIGIMEGRSKLSGVRSQLFLTDEVIPVCSPMSAIAKKQKINLKELTTLPVALRERGSGTLAALKYALGKNGIKLSDLSVRVRLSGTEALKNFILADQCIGFLPMKSVAKELAHGDLVRLFVENLSITRQFYFVQRPGDESRGLGSSFMHFAMRHYNLKV
jgi:DNA-binding transcriptional LysR family regulator